MFSLNVLVAAATGWRPPSIIRVAVMAGMASSVQLL